MDERTAAPLMRVSFDLDEVLFVSPKTHKTEPPLPFPLSRIFQERLRLGAPELIRELQAAGYQVWIYTSSERSERYIRRLFRLYGVKLNGIVNAERHLREVQGNRRERLPQKLPSRYRISLHVDDEAVIASWGREYGFHTYLLNAQDDDWQEKILTCARRIRRMEHPETTEGAEDAREE